MSDKKTREGHEWTAITDLRFRNADDAMADIAAILRSGQADQQFLDMLADLLDPAKQRSLLGVKLTLKRLKGAPKGKPNLDLEDFLQMHIDFFSEPTEVVFAEAKTRFGVSRSTCAAALKDRRASYQGEPELLDRFRQAAIELRKCGHPDYQPLWESK